MILSCLLVSGVLGQNDPGAEKANKFLNRATDRISYVFGKEAGDVKLGQSTEDRLEAWKKGVPETAEEEKERASEKSNVTVLALFFATEGVNGLVSISIYDTEPEAKAWFTKMRKSSPLQPAIEIRGLAHEAFRFRGGQDDPESTGSLFFRMKNITVQVNGAELDTALRIGRLMERVVAESLE